MLQFIDSDKLIVVAELVDCWEVFVLLAVLEWQVRIRVSPKQNFGKLILKNTFEDTLGNNGHFFVLVQLYNSQSVAIEFIGSSVQLVTVNVFLAINMLIFGFLSACEPVAHLS